MSVNTSETMPGDARISRNRDDTVVLNEVVPRKHPGRWIGVALLTVFVLQFVHSAVVNPNFHWNVFAKYLFAPQVLSGVGWTLILTIASMALAIVCAITLVLMRESDNPIYRGLAWVWIWFFRGTPLYTQLLFWGLVAVLFPRISLSIPFGPEIFGVPTQWVITAGVAALLGLGLNESAYLAEIFRAGFKAIDRGQTEAAQAIGMSRTKIWWRILMPQAMRTIIPPTGNETIGMLKGTSLVLAVPFTLDLMFATNAIANRLYLPVPMLMVAAFWYLVVTSILMVGQFYLERHFGKGQDYVETRHV
ncbi:amino acid ABC transporter permease [Nitratireductor kimnyeongensis]|uniref:Amino acid ABC transporter permease n=1 Tax=Nitratireductor kimnyeongensis TaxID=430679 RepID=A0ABW0T5P0_9HYPH|nr:amino acid ABC transporter permease [Nitratireductor kimnyeongensis]